MPNNTGLIFGDVRTSSGQAAGGAEVSLNFILGNTDGTQVRVGSDDNLSHWVPKVTVDKNGRYALPFFWEAADIAKVAESGGIASMLGIRFASDMTYSANNQRGKVVLGLDLRKLFGAVAPPIPSSGGEWAALVRDMIASYRDLLPKHGGFPMQPMFSTEVWGLLGKINITLR